MHPKAIQALASELEDVMRRAEIGEEVSQTGARIWNVGGQALISMQEPEVDRFEELITTLAREESWRDKWSTSYIEHRLLDLMLQVRASEQLSALEGVSQLDTEVREYSQEVTVYIPISGLILEMDSLAAGAVVFNRTTTKLKSEMKAKLTAFYPAWSAEVRERLTLEDAEEVSIRSFQTSTNAEYRVVAEPVRARERACEEARRASEVLTLACTATFPNSESGNTVISLQGEGYLVGPVVTVTTDSGLDIHQSAVPSSMPVSFDENSLPTLKHKGILDLFEILQRPIQHVSDIDQAILRAVHWFATAQAQVEPENRLLNLITALEVLLSPKERAPIAASVSEAVALILKQIYDERREMKSFVGKMYNARSGISHGGTRPVFETEIRHLRNIVVQLILHVIGMRDSIKSRKDLLEWTERLRLGGQSD